MNMTTVPSNQLKAMQHQLAAQELVIQQLRDALDYIDSENASEEVLRRALQALAIPTSTEHLEAWYKEMVGEPVGWKCNENGLWAERSEPTDTPLHAIKPFPFKEK